MPVVVSLYQLLPILFLAGKASKKWLFGITAVHGEESLQGLYSLHDQRLTGALLERVNSSYPYYAD